MQPNYSQLDPKFAARKENISLYRKLTGNHSIPVNKQYWTLCNYQPIEDGSEIEQLVNAGLLKREQFYGVDRNEEIIRQNKIWHDDANWFAGEWLDVIKECESFNPSLVYLDTCSFADHHVACDMTSRTMRLCPPETVLFVNVMGNDPRSKRQFDPQKLIDNIRKTLTPTERSRWKPNIKNYIYSATGRTYMYNCIFQRS